MSNNINRESRIVNVGIISIITNVLLSTFKAIVGLLSHSIAIILDAVNNLSDALSSIVTIVGAKLARKAPDKKHPYGYGRVEYISAMIVAFIILYAGFTSLVESIKKVFNPVVPDYSNVGLFIIAVAIIVKEPLSLVFLAAPKNLLGIYNALGSKPPDKVFPLDASDKL